jgi:hypothetical protein
MKKGKSMGLSTNICRLILPCRWVGGGSHLRRGILKWPSGPYNRNTKLYNFAVRLLEHLTTELALQVEYESELSQVSF